MTSGDPLSGNLFQVKIYQKLWQTNTHPEKPRVEFNRTRCPPRGSEINIGKEIITTKGDKIQAKKQNKK